MNTKQKEGKSGKNTKILGYNGDLCLRCKQPTEIREHKQITQKQLRQPFYYSRWFKCINLECKTTLIMPDRFMVFKKNLPKHLINCFKSMKHRETLPRVVKEEEEYVPDDIVMTVLNETSEDKPPWE